MATKEWLQSNITQCKVKLAQAEHALEVFMAQPENNVFDDMDTAKNAMHTLLVGRADEDCEGSHNCGREKYTQLFMVGDTTYEAVMTLEYNRHDKTYYYVDEITSFEVKEIT